MTDDVANLPVKTRPQFGAAPPHVFADVVRVDASESESGYEQTERTCKNCGATRITILGPMLSGLVWRAWRRGGDTKQISTAVAPPCDPEAPWGGIPCQPHSLAGKRKGSGDERDLWSDARRIIVQSRPWIVLIENVRGMLSAGNDEVAGAERVWRDLRKLGFKVEIGLFTAAEVGASHERERVFILALADGAGPRCDRWQDTRANLEDASGYGCGRSQLERDGGELADASGDRQQWRAQSDGAPLQSEQQAPRRRDAQRCNFDVVTDRNMCEAGDHEMLERYGDAEETWQAMIDNALEHAGAT